ncbi:MAG: type IV secretion system protein, partial [Burkholderiaceae bacterium]
AWQGLSLIRGVGGQHVFLDLLAGNFRTLFVLLAALGASSGYQDLSAAANELQSALVTSASTGISSASAPAVLDSQLTSLADAFNQLTHVAFDHIQFSLGGGADLTGLEILALGLFVTGCIAIYLAVLFVEITAIQVALLLVFAIGPLFVAAAAFRATSSYFGAWLQGVLRYVIEIAFLLALAGIGVGLMGQILTNLNSDLGVGSGAVGTSLNLGVAFLNTLLTAVIIVYFTTKIHAIAASVLGGASLAGAGVALASALGGFAGGTLGARIGWGSLPTSSANQRGIERVLESHAFPSSAAREPGTGSAPDTPHLGIETLGPNWTSERSKSHHSGTSHP